MNDSLLLSIIEHDEMYRVIRVLADRPSGRTELVRGSGIELLVRKYIPLELANKHAWETLRTIDSEQLPQVRDLYQLPDTLVVITTYVDGMSLAELVEQTGSVDASTAASLMLDLCQAASLLHEHGIVHRDISPGNVIINDGHARIIDLGNARTYVEGAKHDTTHLGTWGFAAPEQYGFAQTDARSDIYSLGSVLGYLLTGIQPGDEGFDEALADGTRVPTELRIVVQKARSFEPSARFQNVAEMVAALRACGAITTEDLRAFMLWPVDADKQRQGGKALLLRILRMFVPALPASRRTWSELRHLEKTFIVCLWAVSIFLLIPLSAGFFSAGDGKDWGYAIASYVVAVIWTLTIVLLVREIHLLVTCLGPGRSTKEVIKIFGIRVIVLAAFCLGLSVLFAALFLALGKAL